MLILRLWWSLVGPYRYRRRLDAQQIAQEPGPLALVVPPHGPASPVPPQELPALFLPLPAGHSLDLPLSEVPVPSAFIPVSPAGSGTNDDERDATAAGGVGEEAQSTAAPEHGPVSPSSPVFDQRAEEEKGGEAELPSGDLHLALTQALSSPSGLSDADSMAIVVDEGVDEAVAEAEGQEQGGEEMEFPCPVVPILDAPITATQGEAQAEEAGRTVAAISRPFGDRPPAVLRLVKWLQVRVGTAMGMMGSFVDVNEPDLPSELLELLPFGRKPSAVLVLTQSLEVTVGERTAEMGSWVDKNDPDLSKHIEIIQRLGQLEGERGEETGAEGSGQAGGEQGLTGASSSPFGDRPAAALVLLESLEVKVGGTTARMSCWVDKHDPALPNHVVQRLAGIEKGKAEEAGAVGVGQEAPSSTRDTISLPAVPALEDHVLQGSPSRSGHTTAAAGTAVEGGEAASDERAGLAEGEQASQSAVMQVPVGPSSSVQVNAAHGIVAEGVEAAGVEGTGQAGGGQQLADPPRGSALPNAGLGLEGTAEANETQGIASVVQLQAGEEGDGEGEEQMGSQPAVAVVEAMGVGAIAGGAEVEGGGGQGNAGQKHLNAKQKRSLIKAANKRAKLEAAAKRAEDEARAAVVEQARQRELAATAPQEAKEREGMAEEEIRSQGAEQMHRAAVAAAAALDTVVRAAPQVPAVAHLCCPLTGVSDHENVSFLSKHGI